MAKDRFNKDKSGTVAYLNVVIDGEKSQDTVAISKIVDAIEAGQFEIACYISTVDGEPKVRITPKV